MAGGGALPRLRYFMFPGRAYAARVALFNALGKDGWVDERLGQTAFRKMKEAAGAERRQKLVAETLPTNNLPQLIIPPGYGHRSTELVVTQSHAIARWAAQQGAAARTDARSYNLYPGGRDLEASLLIDEAMSLVDAVVGYAPKDNDKLVRMQKREAYAERGTGFLYLGLAHLESRLASAAESTGSGDAFLLGRGADRLSLADLYLKKPLTDMILDKQFDGVTGEWLETNFPRVRAHTDAVAAHPLVVEYMKHYKN